MATAVKAEVAALYLNAQEALAIQQCLLELGHLQPPTPFKTDNFTTVSSSNAVTSETHS